MKKNIFRLHALKRMLERSITKDEVLDIINNGELIKNYDLDRPYPSNLVFKAINKRPIHVVYATSSDKIIIITVYEPTTIKWEENFKIRRIS